MIDEATKLILRRILNCFENDSGSPETDYSSIYIYHDGKDDRRQVTLARGFTDDGGNLKKVVERYISKGGNYADTFRSRLNKFGQGQLVNDEVFKSTLIKASKEEKVMRDAQDEIFDECYMQPALDWADKNGFKLPLSFGVIFDSYLHSGGILKKLRQRFNEKVPSESGDEKNWISQYLDTRQKWLASIPKLSGTVYRTKFFLDNIKIKNWKLNCPLVANGSKVC
jgi:chitosanase